MIRAAQRRPGGFCLALAAALFGLPSLIAVLAAAGLLLNPAGPARALGEKPPSYMVGFRTVGAAAEGNELTSIAVWYPSQRPRRQEYRTTVGPWEIRAEKNVRPASGLFPVILFSHDMAAHSLANHDLCSALAEAGFVVIAPTHYGDNNEGASALFSAALYYHRPRQLADSLATVASLTDMQGVMNLQRIGLLGCGSGAVTVLQLAGVDIAPDNYAGHCSGAAADPVYCGGWARSRLEDLPHDAAEIRSKYGPEAFTPPLPNIRAVGLLTPGGLFMLDQARLSRLPVPLAAVFAERDELFPAPADNDSLLRLFPAPLFDSVNYMSARETDHYSLGAPCPELIANTLPGLCGSSAQKARERAARERDSYFISFFRAGLGVPLVPQTGQ